MYSTSMNSLRSPCSKASSAVCSKLFGAFSGLVNVGQLQAGDAEPIKPLFPSIVGEFLGDHGRGFSGETAASLVGDFSSVEG